MGERENRVIEKATAEIFLADYNATKRDWAWPAACCLNCNYQDSFSTGTSRLWCARMAAPNCMALHLGAAPNPRIRPAQW